MSTVYVDSLRSALIVSKVEYKFPSQVRSHGIENPASADSAPPCQTRPALELLETDFPSVLMALDTSILLDVAQR